METTIHTSICIKLTEYFLDKKLELYKWQGLKPHSTNITVDDILDPLRIFKHSKVLECVLVASLEQIKKVYEEKTNFNAEVDENLMGNCAKKFGWFDKVNF